MLFTKIKEEDHTKNYTLVFSVMEIKLLYNALLGEYQTKEAEEKERDSGSFQESMFKQMMNVGSWQWEDYMEERKTLISHLEYILASKDLLERGNIRKIFVGDEEEIREETYSAFEVKLMYDSFALLLLGELEVAISLLDEEEEVNKEKGLLDENGEGLTPVADENYLALYIKERADLQERMDVILGIGEY